LDADLKQQPPQQHIVIGGKSDRDTCSSQNSSFGHMHTLIADRKLKEALLRANDLYAAQQ